MSGNPLRSLAGRALRKVIGQRMPVWRLLGAERDSGEPLTLLYIGEDHNRAYLRHLIFRDGCKSESQGMVAADKLASAWHRFAEDADILIIKTEQEVAALAQAPFHAVPCWINVVRMADVDANSTSLKGDLLRIRKYRYSYEVVTDRAGFDDFYHNMYLPFILRRHGEAAMPITYEQMLEQLPRAELLRVKREGAVVAAVMILYGDNVVHSWKIGVRNGDELLAKQGVIAATYLFEAQYLASCGWREIDYGGTRAFLMDGQFQYKKKWGVRLGNAWGQRFYLRPLRHTDGSRSFLASNPFLQLRDGRYEGVACVTDAELTTQQDVDRIVKSCLVDGMDSLSIYGLRGEWRESAIVPCRPEVRLVDGDRLWR